MVLFDTVSWCKIMLLYRHETSVNAVHWPKGGIKIGYGGAFCGEGLYILS